VYRRVDGLGVRILYIDCDSLRPDHLGCYGYHRNTSPNVDRIAADGLRFTDYYASDVPCGPSRTGLFSGRFGIHTGVVNHGGTAADPRKQGPDREVSNTGSRRFWMTALRGAGHETALVSPFPQRHAAFHVLDGFEEWIDTGGGGTERADEVYPHAERWLSEHARDDDWYLHVNFWDPHTHYDTPESFGNPFAGESAPEFPSEGTIRSHYESYGPHSARDVHHWYLTGNEDRPDLPRVPDEIADREDFTRWIDGYDVGIRYMDRYIGELLDQLESAGVREETLVIVSADHGENQGELNVYGDHQTADRATCRVPLIVSGPGVESGVVRGLHYSVDLAPTVTELVGGDVPESWDGRSFADVLTSGSDDGREFLVLSQGTWACQRAVRWDDWLLLRTYHDGFKHFAPVELYDLDEDPHETTDLARERPAVVREGLALLEDWHSRRTMEDALGVNGGNPEGARALRDPLFEVVREGGPWYTRDNLESYASRLRETGREGHAREIERRSGVVAESVSSYLSD
jgi:arylsulfatase A-like enzyme